jgi:hypothetical protein
MKREHRPPRRRESPLLFLPVVSLARVMPLKQERRVSDPRDIAEPG